jgi:hypothetical protein
MSTFLNPAIKPTPPLVSGVIPGNVVMFDGVALEEKCWYCPKRNQIMGLCWEHFAWVKTEVSNLQEIEDIWMALFNPETND